MRDRPAIGGILLWQDQANYLRLTWGELGVDQVAFVGALENHNLVFGRGSLPNASRVVLRLERQGQPGRMPAAALPAVCEVVTLDSMRRRSKAENSGINQVWHGGANTFFFQGANGRWCEVLSAAELALYGEHAVGMLTLEGRTWLEQGRVACGIE